jgi:hypothetical protein
MKIQTKLSLLRTARRTKVAEEWKSLVKQRLARERPELVGGNFV